MPNKYGCRIPCDYVIVSGVGQANGDAGVDHWETGAYDEALMDAGIENFNVMTYTSVIPPEAFEITMDEAKERKLIHHGAVLETIKAELDGEQGEILTTGVGMCKVRKRLRHGEFEYIGGFAAEYEGHSSEEKAVATLAQDLKGIFSRRYKNHPDYEMYDVRTKTRSLIVDEEYGVCFVAICFLTYIYPEVVK